MKKYTSLQLHNFDVFEQVGKVLKNFTPLYRTYSPSKGYCCYFYMYESGFGNGMCDFITIEADRKVTIELIIRKVRKKVAEQLGKAFMEM